MSDDDSDEIIVILAMTCACLLICICLGIGFLIFIHMSSNEKTLTPSLNDTPPYTPRSPFNAPLRTPLNGLSKPKNHSHFDVQTDDNSSKNKIDPSIFKITFSPWSNCPKICKEETDISDPVRTRSLKCEKEVQPNKWTTVEMTNCTEKNIPTPTGALQEVCNAHACNEEYFYETTPWKDCEAFEGECKQFREVRCNRRREGKGVDYMPHTKCEQREMDKPSNSQLCTGCVIPTQRPKITMLSDDLLLNTENLKDGGTEESPKTYESNDMINPKWLEHSTDDLEYYFGSKSVNGTYISGSTPISKVKHMIRTLFRFGSGMESTSELREKDRRDAFNLIWVYPIDISFNQIYFSTRESSNIKLKFDFFDNNDVNIGHSHMRLIDGDYNMLGAPKDAYTWQVVDLNTMVKARKIKMTVVDGPLPGTKWDTNVPLQFFYVRFGNKSLKQ